MYNLKGFITIDSLVSRQAKAISPIGELSTESLTYSRNISIYTDTSRPTLTLHAFTSATVTGYVDVPAALQSQVMRIVEWLYAQQTGNSAVGTPTAVTASLTTQFGSEATQFGAGAMVSGGTFSMPEFITWVNPSLATNDPTAGGLIKIWFADNSFRNQYDDYEIIVVPPITNLDVFMSGPTAVEAALAANTYTQRINAIQLAKGNYPETTIVARTFDYVDPTNSSKRVPTEWTLLIYGQAGNNLDRIQTAIQQYLLANSQYAVSRWQAVFPEIYTSTEFYLIPRWRNIAIPSLTIARGAYSSVVSLAKELAYVKSIFTDFQASYIDQHLGVIPSNYNSLQVLVLGDKTNDPRQQDLGILFPDLINVPPTDTMYNMMSAKTRNWLSMIQQMYILAETATADSTLPPGISRAVRNNVLFLVQEYGGVNYFVSTKNSTPNYA